MDPPRRCGGGHGHAPAAVHRHHRHALREEGDGEVPGSKEKGGDEFLAHGEVSRGCWLCSPRLLLTLVVAVDLSAKLT